MDEAKIAPLTKCIAKHCREIENDPNRLLEYAFTIRINFEKHEQVVRRSSDAGRISKLKMNLEKSLTALGDLSAFSKERIVRNMPLQRSGNEEGAIEQHLASLASLSAAVTQFEKSYVSQNPPMNGLRSNGTAIAASCIKIWREVHGEDKTPTSPHKAHHGPMSRFIKEVIGTLEVGVSAGTAIENAYRLKDLDLFWVSLEFPE
ncbi:hypothetical protein K4L02_00875 [Phaeobacter inhibens]|uniref:hypothetical protein n=1 Tax=Phaeobacter inhibens TaxID=221822 RepID=UPI0021A29761|nr:hypothetical protein [Phaeobacter inhibens]UWR64825.1 hypothetical protein K4L02_00875 [Phaeobacter inhibens]